MARSNSYNYNLTRNGLVTAVYQLLNLYTSEDTISNADMNLGVLLLNAMIKDMEGDGIHLWKRRQAILFPAKGTASYSLSATGDNCTNSYVSTTLTSAAAASATTLALTSTGMTIGDYIGIELTAGTRQWTTIATIPGSTSVTINVGLTGAAASGLTVVSYTSKINRPLRILRATTYNLSSGAESQLTDLSYDEYFDMPIKTTAGRPNNKYYDKLLDNGVLYTYPVTSNVQDIIKFTYDDTLMDMNSANDSFDFPSEWFLTLMYNLSIHVGMAHKLFTEIQAYQPMADKLLQKAKQWNGDEESLQIITDRNGYR